MRKKGNSLSFTEIVSHPFFTGGTTLVGALFVILFGSWMPLMTALLVVQAVDIITGLLKGGREERLTSAAFYLGIRKKVGMWCLIIVGNVLDTTFFAGTPVFKTAITTLLIADEGLSITENLALIGVPIPQSLLKYLAQLREVDVDLTENDEVENEDQPKG